MDRPDTPSTPGGLPDDAAHDSILDRGFPDLFFQMDRHGTILAYHAVAAEDLYTSPQAFLGRSFEAVLPAQAGGLLRDAIEQALQSGRPITVEYTLPLPQGEQAFLARLVALDSQQVFAIIHNVTARRQIEAALRQSEERFARIFQASPTAISLSDPATGRFVDANHSYLRMTGYRHSELIGRTSLEVGLWIDPAERERLVSQARAEGAVRNIEHSFRARSGEIRHALVSYELLDLAGGPTLLGMFFDITERKLAEEQLQQRHREFRALNDVITAVNHSADLHSILTAALAQILAFLGMDGGECHLIDETGDLVHTAQYRLDPAFAAASSGHRASPGMGLVGQAYSGRTVVLANALADDPRFLRRDQARAAGYRAALCVPLLGQKETLGVLTFYGGQHREVPPAERSLLVMIGIQLAIAVERARAYEAEQAARQTAEILARANLALTQMLDLDVVLGTLLDYLAQLVPYDSANVMLIEGTDFVIRAARGYERWTDPARVIGLRLGVEATPVLKKLVTQGESMLVDDTLLESTWIRPAEGGHVRSWLGVPLRSLGQVIGLYSVDKAQPGFFTPAHVRRAEALTAQAAAAIQNALLFEQVRTGQEGLRQLAQQVVAAQEQERQRVSRELHDEANQALVALKFNLDSIREDLPAGFEGLNRRMDDAISLIDTTLAHVRLLAQNLRPPALESIGLNSTLEDYCFDFSERTRLAVDYAGTDLPDLPDMVSICLYRVLQEALTNVAKHAQARAVRVALQTEGEAIRLRIEDDGQGFDPSAGARRAGSGLVGMQERLALLGGALRIDSRPGGGTRLIASVPHSAG